MKIALFSDIHANLPALESCFKSMDERKPDFVYCLGDLVGYNIWPNEVMLKSENGTSRQLQAITIRVSASPAMIAVVRTKQTTINQMASNRSHTQTAS